MITKVDVLNETVIMAANRLAKKIVKRVSPMHKTILDNTILQEAKDLVALIEKRDVAVRRAVTHPEPFILPGCLDNDTPIRTDARGRVIKQRPLGPKVVHMGETMPEEAIARETGKGISFLEEIKTGSKILGGPFFDPKGDHDNS